MQLHVHRRIVRFGECDPAGILYYPRYFEWFHEAMESWFQASLGPPYVELIRGRGLGFPAVHTQASYHRPCAFGADVGVELRVARLGRSSVDLRFAIRAATGELHARGQTVVVQVVIDRSHPDFMQPRPIEGSLRSAVAAYAKAHPASASEEPA